MLCRPFTYRVQFRKYRRTKLSPSFWITLYFNNKNVVNHITVVCVCWLYNCGNWLILHGMENIKLENSSVLLLRVLCPELFIKMRLIRLTFRTLSTEFGRLQVPILSFRLGCGAASLFEGISNLGRWDHHIVYRNVGRQSPSEASPGHIPEVRRPQIHCCKSLSTSMIIILFFMYNFMKSLHQNLRSVRPLKSVKTTYVRNNYIRRTLVYTHGKYFDEKSGNSHTTTMIMMMIMMLHWDDDDDNDASLKNILFHTDTK